MKNWLKYGKIDNGISCFWNKFTEFIETWSCQILRYRKSLSEKLQHLELNKNKWIDTMILISEDQQ